MTLSGVPGISSVVRRAAVLALGSIALSGCLPTPATTQGRAVTDLWTLFAVAAALVGGLVWLLITISVIRYRGSAREPAGQDPPHPHPDDRTPSPGASRALPLEVAWPPAPTPFVIVLFPAPLGPLDGRAAQEPSRTTVAV